MFKDDPLNQINTNNKNRKQQKMFKEDPLNQIISVRMDPQPQRERERENGKLGLQDFLR